MCLKSYEVYKCAHRECIGVYTCDNTCTPITHYDYVGFKCPECQELDAIESARKIEEEKTAIALVQTSKKTDDEYWEKAIDDFLLYVEAKGWVIDGW